MYVFKYRVIMSEYAKIMAYYSTITRQKPKLTKITTTIHVFTLVKMLFLICMVCLI